MGLVALGALLWLVAGAASAQSSCDGALHRFYGRSSSGGGDLHRHFYRVDPETGGIRRGLGAAENDEWGAIFGYWDDGECGYHMDAYVVHFRRVEGARDTDWARASGEWAPERLRHRLMEEFLAWERGEDRVAWTRVASGYQITIVDLTLTWTLQDPFPPRRRRALMRAAEACVTP